MTSFALAPAAFSPSTGGPPRIAGLLPALRPLRRAAMLSREVLPPEVQPQVPPVTRPAGALRGWRRREVAAGGRRSIRTGVVVLGAGTTGLMLALALAKRGIAVAVIGHGRDPGFGRDVVRIGPRALEALPSLGIAEEVRRRGRVLLRVGGSAHGRADDEAVDLSSLTDVSGCNHAVEISRDALAGILISALSADPRVVLQADADATAIRDIPKGVDLDLQCGGEVAANVTARLLIDACGGPARPVAVAGSGLGQHRGQRIAPPPGTGDLPDDPEEAALLARNLAWKVDAALSGRGDPQALLGSAGPELDATFARRRSATARAGSRARSGPRTWSGRARRILRRAAKLLGFEPALALNMSGFLDRHGTSVILDSGHRGLVGERLPDVVGLHGRLHEEIGRWGLILHRAGEQDAARHAHDLGATFGIPVAAMPAALDRLGFVGTMAAYVRPDGVVAVQSGRGETLTDAQVAAALGWTSRA